MGIIRIPQNRKRDRHKSRQTFKPFCGVDGEGGNIDESHEYLLLRAGIDHVLETGKPLGWRECLEFLVSLPRDRTYVAFFFDYDVTMMLRGLPRERLERLLKRELRAIKHRPGSVWPVDIGPYQIDYLPGKEFKVRRNTKGSPWLVIQDVGSFFQTSFVKALKQWFDDGSMDAQIERIAIGKEQRHDFGAVTEDERQYNLLEIRMLELLMTRFRTVCSDLGIRPYRWEGPGNLVAAVFRNEGLPKNKDLALFTHDVQVAVMANRAYYGGRFEVPQFGIIE